LPSGAGMSARVERLMLELAAAMREEIGALPDNILTLGEELKAARAHSRMSLQEVADRSGFTKSHIWEVEQGRSRNPTIGMVAGLSKALGVPFLRLAQAALNSSETPPASVAAEERSEAGCAGTDALDEQNPSKPEGGR
jgi:transcriptional regulator with XRE-family HTH domain